jgi:hypothetical protein
MGHDSIRTLRVGDRGVVYDAVHEVSPEGVAPVTVLLFDSSRYHRVELLSDHACIVSFMISGNLALERHLR